ncbi:AraC family transcriptional regulator [Kitasatospora sp. NPDC004531]
MLSAARYLTLPPEVRAVGLAVTGVGRIVGQRASRSRPAPAGYAGVLVTEGTSRLERADRPGPFELGPGSFFWLPPGTAHGYGPSPGAWSEYWVLFEGPATAAYEAAYEALGQLAAGPAVRTPQDVPALLDQFERLLLLASRPESPAVQLTAAATLHTLIAALGAPAEEDLAARAVRLLLEESAAPVRLADAARRLNISHDTLIALVRRRTGTTPSDFLTRHRLSRAKSLLATTDRTVAAIAREVGYPDAAYFTRVFTRRTGLSPSAFRRQQHP